MCGIFGMATNNPNKINAGNVRILGLANESRGKDSCGISFDGEIYYGLDSKKLFSNFIKGFKIKPEKYPIIIGHTRMSSVGLVNDHNAHPFGFGDNNGDYEQIFVHNGTLLNHDDLAKYYDIDEKETYVDGKTTMTRNKIDSEILGEILYKTKTFKVLSEYNGRAALVWTNTNQPNTIYLYSGKSVPEHLDSQDKACEERPMNVYIEDDNTFYFSSLKESLEIIGGDDSNTFQIDYNTVYIVKDGDFKNADKIRISRKNNYHTKTWGTAYSTGRNYLAYGYGEFDDLPGYSHKQTSLHLPGRTEEVSIYHHILDDVLERGNVNDYKGKIYNKNFRYYRNNHLVTGVFIHIPNYGFHHVGHDTNSANEYLHNNKKRYLDFNSGFITSKKGKASLAFKDMSDQLYFFVEGMMMITSIDYNIMLERHKANTIKRLTAMTLSQATVHPVIDLTLPRGSMTMQRIFKNGALYTGEFRGLEYERTYKVETGNLLRSTFEKPKVEIIVPDNNKVQVKVESYLDKFCKELKIPETNYDYFNSEENKIYTEAEATDFLVETSYEEFSNIIDSVESLEDKIKPFKSHNFYIELSNSIKKIKKVVNEYIPITNLN